MVSLQITSTSQVQASALDLPYTCEILACYGSSTAQWYAINDKSDKSCIVESKKSPDSCYGYSGFSFSASAM